MNDRRDNRAPGPDELREQVRSTREELGRSVEALAERADVKAQARQRADATRERAVGAAHDAQETAARALRTAYERTPEPVREKAAHAASAARGNGGLVLAAAAALAVAFLLGRGCRR
ncbi:DUF3618 domain-containing protein [Streptomyces sp. t39]|uniref:DUF3618 domain-containing protein n=1 Tax=Streptomyces sp. t39 TaxID=1828156 RepID=UPI0011CE295B|nr:DUF3618 domain-containing protein [Streptomyces sp. t39]TXS52442.1 DUF3618 domain-containing protein [Streptomyces sp. t39]